MTANFSSAPVIESWNFEKGAEPQWHFYFEKTNRTHEPNQDIAGYSFFAHGVYLCLHFFLRNGGKSGLAAQAGKKTDHERKKQNSSEFFHYDPP